MNRSFDLHETIRRKTARKCSFLVSGRCLGDARGMPGRCLGGALGGAEGPWEVPWETSGDLWGTSGGPWDPSRTHLWIYPITWSPGIRSAGQALPDLPSRPQYMPQTMPQTMPQRQSNEPLSPMPRSCAAASSGCGVCGRGRGAGGQRVPGGTGRYGYCRGTEGTGYTGDREYYY